MVVWCESCNTTLAVIAQRQSVLRAEPKVEKFVYTSGTKCKQTLITFRENVNKSHILAVLIIGAVGTGDDVGDTY